MLPINMKTTELSQWININGVIFHSFFIFYNYLFKAILSFGIATGKYISYTTHVIDTNPFFDGLLVMAY